MFVLSGKTILQGPDRAGRSGALAKSQSHRGFKRCTVGILKHRSAALRASTLIVLSLR